MEGPVWKSKCLVYIMTMLIICNVTREADAIRCYTGITGQQLFIMTCPDGSCFWEGRRWEMPRTIMYGCVVSKKKDGCHRNGRKGDFVCYCNSDFCNVNRHQPILF